jgi:hypothetical protein
VSGATATESATLRDARLVLARTARVDLDSVDQASAAGFADVFRRYVVALVAELEAAETFRATAGTGEPMTARWPDGSATVSAADLGDVVEGLREAARHAPTVDAGALLAGLALVLGGLR